jgi:hypothetical protein
MEKNYENDLSYNIVISGAGVSGTAIFSRLVENLEKREFSKLKIRLIIIEKSLEFGPGTPYTSSTNDNALLHVPAIIMSINPHNMSEFVDYLKENDRMKFLLDELQITDPELVKCYSSPDPFQSYPRFWFGNFLKSEFEKTVLKADSKGIDVLCLSQHEVLKFEKKGKFYQVDYSDLQTNSRFSIDNINTIILSTGFWPTKNYLSLKLKDVYSYGIYPIKKLKNLNVKVKNVLILGSNLSAVDALLAIFESKGKFFHSENPLEWSYSQDNSENKIKIFIFSGTGRLPEVSGKITFVKNKYFNKENIKKLSSKGYITLEEYLDLINQDITILYGKNYTIDDIINEHLGPTTYENFKEQLIKSQNGDIQGGFLGTLSVFLQSDLLIFRSLYLLDSDSRKIMEEKYWHIINKYTSILPMINSSKLLALLKLSLIEFKAINNKKYSISQINEKVLIDFGEDIYEFDHVVDCRGYNIKNNDFDSEIAQYMVNEKQIKDYIVQNKYSDLETLNFGGFDVDTESLNLINRYGEVEKNVFYTGIAAVKKIFTSAALVQGYISIQIAEKIIQDINYFNNLSK